MTPQKSFILCNFLSIIIIFLSINSTKAQPNCKLISGGGGVHLCDKLFANPSRSSTIRIFSITPSPSSPGLLLLESDLIYEVSLALGQLLLLSPQKKFWFDHSLLFGRTDKLDGCQPVLLYNFELPPEKTKKSSKKSPPSSVLHLYTEASEYKFWSGIKEPEVSPSRVHPDFSTAFFQNGSQTRGYLITSSLQSGTEKEKGQQFNSLNLGSYIISDLELDDLGNVSFDASKNLSSSSFYLQRTSNPFEVALVPVQEVQGENLDLQNSQKLALFRHHLPAAFLQPHNNTLFLFDHFRRCVYIVEHFPVELKKLKKSQILQRINIPYEHFFCCPFLEKEGQNVTFVEDDDEGKGRCDRNYIGSPDDDGHFDPLLWVLLWSFTVFTLSVAIILLCYCCCGVHSLEEEEGGENLVNLKGKGKTPKRARFFFGRWRTPGPSKLSPKTTSSKTPDTSSSSTATIMPMPRFEAKTKEEEKEVPKTNKKQPLIIIDNVDDSKDVEERNRPKKPAIIIKELSSTLEEETGEDILEAKNNKSAV